MNDETKQPDSPEALVSRAIDDVLAAEKDAGRAIEEATATAQEMHREANESAHRILARAERRIRALHGQVAGETRREVERLNTAAAADARDAPAMELDTTQIERLAAALAEWLTSDADG